MPVRVPYRPRLTAAAALLLAVTACGSSGSSGGGPSGAATSIGVTPTESGTATGSPSDVLTATRAFLALLDDTQKKAVQGERTRANLAQWSNLPDQLFKRAGLRMDKLTAGQRAAVLAVLKAGLSTDGFNQVAGITTADGVLAASAQMNLDFGADHYWIRILGEPSSSAAWTVQYGGHHLGINMTMKGAAMTLAPSFWGAQPATYTAGGAATEPLAGETRKAFALIGALDDDQQAEAVMDSPITEIVLGAGQDGRTVANEGIPGSALTADQRRLLTDLISEWITTVNPAAARAKLATATRELARTSFAWYGETTMGNPVYYRVTSPSYVIEFAHQQGQGANAGGVTHIHAIYREIGNDYGAKL